ncbi:hypothetical protein [Reyranella sp.]|uniref:hypothetical protein n=1 Tax=Reyranella sp. TaxID=1929291 RepID=UPI003D138F35
MLSRRTILQTSLAGSMVAGLAGLAAFANFYPKPDRDEEITGWRRIPWPFPRDAFPAGRAWKRDDTEVYIRPKLGLCGNCDAGVVEDSEVDRVSDIDLLDEQFVPLREGKRIQLTDLTGRARLYRIRKGGRERVAEGIAVSYKCDLVVAIVVGPVADDAILKNAHRFLETNTVQVWINALLEGR